MFAAHRVDEQLAKALDRKVWLPSGGSLVIDRTEAMVVIDVNTGKYVGKGGNLEETVTRNNLEAAEEIARQLRLRDLGGIIVVDFIDMVLESNRDLVVRRLVECLGRDRTKHQVAEVTSLGLVQMTRKRVGQGLLESFSETCEACGGRGVIVHAARRRPRPRRAAATSGDRARAAARLGRRGERRPRHLGGRRSRRRAAGRAQAARAARPRRATPTPDSEDGGRRADGGRAGAADVRRRRDRRPGAAGAAASAARQPRESRPRDAGGGRRRARRAGRRGPRPGRRRGRRPGRAVPDRGQPSSAEETCRCCRTLGSVTSPGRGAARRRRQPAVDRCRR